jgi:hypothetical protein
MRHRNDLEDILLNGLPEQERRQVVKVRQQVTTETLRYRQSPESQTHPTIDLHP